MNSRGERRPTRVILTLDLPPLQDGGIATLVDVLATGLRSLDEDVVVYARGRGQEVEDWDRSRPYPVVRMWGHSWIRNTSRNVTPYLLKIYAKHRPADIYLASWQIAGAAAAVSGRLGASLTALVYGRDVTARDPLPGALRRVDRILALTDWLARELRERGLDDDRIHAVHAAVHPPCGAGDPGSIRRRFGLGEAPVVLCVGRLIPRKGQDALIEAWPHVRRRIPDARLLVVGEGPDRARLEAGIGDLAAGDSIQLAGFLGTGDLESAYRAADLFAMPCREEAGGDTEGFGLVYLEAGARGLPVIGGRTAGVVEAVIDGQTGLLVEPGDGRALVDAVVGLLADRDRAWSMGEAGRRRVESSYTPEHYARRVLRAGGW